METTLNRYEVHITIKLDVWCAIEAKKQLADMIAAGFKVTFIELSSGEFPRQVMLTYYTLKGSIADVIEDYNKRLSAIVIVRVKIEVGASSVPAEYLPKSGQYYEFHLLVETVDPVCLDHSVKCIDKDLRVSRSPFKRSDHFFITLRDFTQTRSEAIERIDRILARIDLPVLKLERELVVYDSNISIDRGWL